MAVADLPPQVSATFQEVCTFYELEGDSGRRLLDEFSTAMEQWHHRPGMSNKSFGDSESITHLPFETAGKIRVRFKMAGKMTPRVIDAAGTGEE
ncbi:MAG: hypothetical protein WKF77_07010 [Planctomycetaceae bacterium]